MRVEVEFGKGQPRRLVVDGHSLSVGSVLSVREGDDTTRVEVEVDDTAVERYAVEQGLVPESFPW